MGCEDAVLDLFRTRCVEKMPAILGFPSEELAEAFIKDLDVQALIGSAGHLIY